MISFNTTAAAAVASHPRLESQKLKKNYWILPIFGCLHQFHSLGLKCVQNVNAPQVFFPHVMSCTSSALCCNALIAAQGQLQSSIVAMGILRIGLVLWPPIFLKRKMLFGDFMARQILKQAVKYKYEPPVRYLTIIQRTSLALLLIGTSVDQYWSKACGEI